MASRKKSQPQKSKSVPEAPQQSKLAPDSSWDVLLQALPQLKKAFEVIFSPDPIKAAGKENFSRHSIFSALCLSMILAMLVILSSSGAPFVDPWTYLWTYKFKFFFQPSYNFRVLLLCALSVIGSCLLSYLVNFYMVAQLIEETPETKKLAEKLAGYMTICVACTYAFTLILIYLLGWILYAFKIHIFIYGWMVASFFIVIPFATWKIASIIKRSSLIRKSHIKFSLVISMSTALSCLVGTIFVQESLDAGMLKYGRAVNAVRSTPVAAVVQACAKASADVICAITLYPGQWQDYEIIGDWTLEDVSKSHAGQPIRFNWHPGKESDRQFALVTLAARKEVTIEIRSSVTSVCKSDGTFIGKDDRFFLAQGRVTGEQHDAPKKMRLRIDNTEWGFVEMMEQACLSERSA